MLFTRLTGPFSPKVRDSKEESFETKMKKSLYVFLSSMLGVMLFLCIHRIVIFFSLVFSSNSGSEKFFGLTYIEFLALDYFTLILTLLLGAWYGIWVGLHWYDKVYEQGFHNGFLNYVIGNYWPKASNPYNLNSKLVEVKRQLEKDLEQIEDIAETAVLSSTKPVKKRVVRRKVK